MKKLLEKLKKGEIDHTEMQNAIEKFKKFHIGKGKVYSKDKKRIEELSVLSKDLPSLLGD